MLTLDAWRYTQPRAKLEPDPARPRCIVTEAGLGYRLRVDEPAGEGS